MTGFDKNITMVKKIYDKSREDKIWFDELTCDDTFITFDIEGDWKHEHLRYRWWLEDNFDVMYISSVVRNSDDDYYRASYRYIVKEN